MLITIAHEHNAHAVYQIRIQTYRVAKLGMFSGEAGFQLQPEPLSTDFLFRLKKTKPLISNGVNKSLFAPLILQTPYKVTTALIHALFILGERS